MYKNIVKRCMTLASKVYKFWYLLTYTLYFTPSIIHTLFCAIFYFLCIIYIILFLSHKYFIIKIFFIKNYLITISSPSISIFTISPFFTFPSSIASAILSSTKFRIVLFKGLAPSALSTPFLAINSFTFGSNSI